MRELATGRLISSFARSEGMGLRPFSARFVSGPAEASREGNEEATDWQASALTTNSRAPRQIQ